MQLVLASLLLTASPADTYLATLVTFEPYAESIWHEAGYFGDGASGGNGGIRGTCGIMVAYATLIRSGAPGDQERRLAHVVAGLRYAADSHLTGNGKCVDGKQWGHGWQTNLWAGSLGLATLLLEDRLPPDVVAAVKRVIADEADFRAAIPPASGFRGDSKAEENAWNSNIPALAAAWLRDHPHRDAWLGSAKACLTNTYTVEAHDDDPLAEQISTVTLLPSFMCENHGFFHPSYQMVAGMSLGDSLTMAHLADPDTAALLRPYAEHNVLRVWEGLSQVLLDSGELAYPAGLDWALHGYGQVSYYAWLATHFQDPLAAWAEPRLAALVAARQQVNRDGRFTGESVPDGFYREAVVARRVAIAWWQHQVNPEPPAGRAPPPFVAHLPDVGLLLQRGEHGFVSLSYGHRVTVLVVPPAPYLVTPRVPGLLVDAQSAEVTDVSLDDHGFDVALLLRDGPLHERRARLVSRSGVVVLLEGPSSGLLPPGGGGVFPLGIENHALTGGRRHLVWATGEGEAVERSGKVLADLGRWVCLDERYSVVAGPDGRWSYHTASGYNRNGAAEDLLSYQPADPAGARFAVVLPTQGQAAARALAGTLKWQTEGGRATLTLPLPEGEWSVDVAATAAPPRYARLPVRQVTASTASQAHGADLAADGDPATFWVSNHDGAEPGHGPTPERPEWLELALATPGRVDALLLVPRPQYGPKRLELVLDGEVVWSGGLSHQPLLVPVEPGRVASTVRLRMLESYDPRYPDRSRNVQVAEVMVLGIPAVR